MIEDSHLLIIYLYKRIPRVILSLQSYSSLSSCISLLLHLIVNGFGTETFIYGGSFIGGKGIRGDGLSLYVLNSAMVHVRGGSFVGDMKAERRGVIAFYGCFMRNGTQVTGIFEDESELDVTIRTYYGGEVLLIPLAEQECDTAPSMVPTNFPTITHMPTVPRPNDSSMRRVGISLIIVAAYVVLSVL